MAKVTTQVFKNVFGWAASSKVQLQGNLYLTIDTHKVYSRDIVTNAKVVRMANTPCGTAFTHSPYQDFNLRLEACSPKRVTQGIVEAQHQRGLDRLQEVKDAAMYFHRREMAEEMPEAA